MPRLRLAGAGAAGLVLLAVLVTGPAAVGGPATPGAALDPAMACRLAGGRTRDVTVDVAGQGVRTALVRLPPGGGRRRLPLVIALHGARAGGAFMERYSGFSRLADADGFAVAYPSARGPRWTLSPGHGPDDVAFIGRLLDRLLAGRCVDPARVYVAGVSNGGGLAALLGCEMSGRLAAIAAVAGGYRELPECRADHPLSVLEIHGTADQVVPYHEDGAGDVMEWVRSWVARDGCAPRAARRTVVSRVTRYDWTRCRGGVAVAHEAIDGGQHAWPGGDPPDPGPSTSLSATVEAWRFFAGRRRACRPTAATCGPH